MLRGGASSLTRRLAFRAAEAAYGDARSMAAISADTSVGHDALPGLGFAGLRFSGAAAVGRDRRVMRQLLAGDAKFLRQAFMAIGVVAIVTTWRFI